MQTRGIALAQQISEKHLLENLPTPAKGNRLHHFSGATLAGQEGAERLCGPSHGGGHACSFVLFQQCSTRKAYWETLGRWDENAWWGGTLTVRETRIVRADKLAKDLRNGQQGGSAARAHPSG